MSAATQHLCLSVCGSACCRTPQMQVNLTEDEAQVLHVLAEGIGVPEPKIWHVTGGLVMEMGDHGRCTFLDHTTGKCRIYSARPGACRRFPHRPVKGCLLNPGTEGEGVAGNGIPR